MEIAICLRSSGVRNLFKDRLFRCPARLLYLKNLLKALMEVRVVFLKLGLFLWSSGKSDLLRFFPIEDFEASFPFRKNGDDHTAFWGATSIFIFYLILFPLFPLIFLAHSRPAKEERTQRHRLSRVCPRDAGRAPFGRGPGTLDSFEGAEW